jgi:predicted transcriptional regulator
MSDQPAQPDVLSLTAQIVAAHVSNNPVAPEALPALIQEVHRALAGLSGGVRVASAPMAEPAEAPPPIPAVPVRRSVFPDYIVCLEDGKKQKMLKRHLQTAHAMTPEAYREKWGLPPDYPMVAPTYAKQRSSLAKRIGLGTKPRAER